MEINKDKIKEIVEFLQHNCQRKPSDVAEICSANKELVEIVIEAFNWCDYYRRLEVNDLDKQHKGQIKILQQQISDLTQFKLDTAEKFIYDYVKRTGMY